MRTVQGASDRSAARVLGIVLALAAVASTPAAQASETRVRWTFGGEAGWSGWTPNGLIGEVRLDEDAAAFRTTGSDPQILGPLFELAPATGDQWVEVDIEIDGPGEGELFFTNATTGRYGGLQPRWMSRVVVPAAGRQTLRIWPFWGGLGKIIRLRFDPPSGRRCRLRSISVVELAHKPVTPAWSFSSGEPTSPTGETETSPPASPPSTSSTSWASLHAAEIDLAGGALRARALAPQAMIVTPVVPFDAAARSLLRIEAACPGERVLGVYWVTAEETGLQGEPVDLIGPEGTPPREIDLRLFPTWKGTVTHLALGFGSLGGETLRIPSLSIEPVDPGRPFLRVSHAGFREPIRRAGSTSTLWLEIENAGGVPTEAMALRLETDQRLALDESELRVGPLAPSERATLQTRSRLVAPGRTRLELRIGDQRFERRLRIDPPLEGGGDRLGARAAQSAAKSAADDAYAVPPPRPVESDYRLGVYYFPGWSPDQLDRWEKQAGFPERDPVLGWYAEGSPEVADWHIKWAVENGISFFIYDWYWREGREELGAGLNDGFLKARYRDRMQFALMWANHPPFSAHTPEQLLEVTDYWTERFLRQPNYLRVDGLPYVSFFSPGELLSGLGSEEDVARALESMRERARSRGLPGLHIAVCGGSDRPTIESFGRCGFDSVTAYNYLRTGAMVEHSAYRPFLLGHAAIWDACHAAGRPPYVPVLTVGWDSRPWHGPRAERKFARRTEDFREGLERLRAWLDASGGASGGRMAILEAWNEWGEGSYIEPNAEFGFEDLEAIREVFARPGARPENVAPQDLGIDGRYDLRRR